MLVVSAFGEEAVDWEGASTALFSLFCVLGVAFGSSSGGLEVGGSWVGDGDGAGVEGDGSGLLVGSEGGGGVGGAGVGAGAGAAGGEGVEVGAIVGLLVG